LKEVYRVLKNNGWFIITDVYAKKPEYIGELDKFSLNSCVRGLHDLYALEEKLEKEGFDIQYIEDYSPLLKELMVKIVFSYGSMGIFWNRTTNNCIDGCEFEKILRLCKPGYFMIIAKKGEADNG
jgi:SAM-dependent methyltransferase